MTRGLDHAGSRVDGGSVSLALGGNSRGALATLTVEAAIRKALTAYAEASAWYDRPTRELGGQVVGGLRYTW